MSATANHIYIYGDSSLDEKISLITSKISNASGRNNWIQLFRSNPTIVPPYEIAVLFRSIFSSKPIPFMFEVAGGSYNISLRCFASTPAPATGKSQLDSGNVLTWSTAPGYTVYQQIVPLYSATTLSPGLHEIVISCIKPIALLDLSVKNTDGSEDVVVQAINTFLFPNRILGLSRSLEPEYIVPALNTRLFGPTLPPGVTVPPYTGTPHPETCYEPTDAPMFSANPILVLSGTQTTQQKLDVANQIWTYCGRTQWVKFLTSLPNIVSGNETAVILNSTDAALTFRFAVPTGFYNIVVRCIMPSANSDSGLVQLDSFPQQTFTRAFGPGKYSTSQFNVLLYEKLKLEDGYHQLVFTGREPMGYIALTINRADQQSPDIVITADAVLKNPLQVFGNADYLATFTPPVFTTMPPTTTLMPTTTMMPELKITIIGLTATQSDDGTYIIVTITGGSGTLSINQNRIKADLLIVGGGGNGGSAPTNSNSTQYSGRTATAYYKYNPGGGGGGGGGACGYGTMNFVAGESYNMVVGSATQSSTITGLNVSAAAGAGSNGRDAPSNAKSGASGGMSGVGNSSGSGMSLVWNSQKSGGNSKYALSQNNIYYTYNGFCGGGGGGSSTNGNSVSSLSDAGGTGGNGISSTIFGGSYGGGGGGGGAHQGLRVSKYAAAAGGSGGGGDGGAPNSNGSNGTPNSGGGGGGATSPYTGASRSGGTGGSGVIKIRFSKY